MVTSDNGHWTERDIELWNIKKEKLRIKYPFLSEDDLKFREGSENMMIMLLCYKLHLTKAMMSNLLAAL
jgi:hypothetical protein